MSEATLQQQIAAATAYEELFVPALFEPWVGRVVESAQIKPRQRVLDVGCGTGVLAREAALRTGPSGFVAGVDVAPGMLAVAGRLAPTIEWREGSADALPYPDHSFDAVLSQFALMFFPDRVRSLGEMLRVLTPGGRLSAAVWDSLDNIPAYANEVALLERLAGESAAEALRAPFMLGNSTELSELAEEAGVASPLVTTEYGTARFPSVRSAVEADLRGWLPLMGVHLSEELIEQILEEAERDLGSYVSAAGEMIFEVSAHILTGSKPPQRG